MFLFAFLLHFFFLGWGAYGFHGNLLLTDLLLDLLLDVRA